MPTRSLFLSLLLLAAVPVRAQVELVAAPSEDAGSFVRDLTEFDGWLYFVATDQDQIGNELWRTDGTTTEAFDINPEVYASSNPDGLTPFAGWLYFSAETPDAGDELWRTNGTVVERVADLVPGSAASSPTDLTPLGDHLYFSAYAASGDKQLWRTNGETAELVRPAPDEPVYGPIPHASFGGWLYFSRAVDGTFRLWRTDGAAFEPVGGLWTNGAFAAFGGHLYFDATGEDAQSELWRTDGTSLEQVTAIGSTNYGARPSALTASGDHLYFRVVAGQFPDEYTELWRTDGVTLKQVEGVQNMGELTDVAGRLFFVAEEAGAAPDTRELWRVVGAEADRVADLYPGPRSSWPSHLTALGATLYFAAETEVTGFELWRTDGSDVALVADVNPGPSSSYPHELTVYNGLVYFCASTAEHDTALWRAGSMAVTNEVPPSATGEILSAPYPNPFHHEVTLALTVPQPEHVRVSVHDALGRTVAVLHDGEVATGEPHRLTLSGTDLASGLYVIRAAGPSFTASRRITLVR